jgi:hypothetical protein
LKPFNVAVQSPKPKNRTNRTPTKDQAEKPAPTKLMISEASDSCLLQIVPRFAQQLYEIEAPSDAITILQPAHSLEDAARILCSHLGVPKISLPDSGHVLCGMRPAFFIIVGFSRMSCRIPKQPVQRLTQAHSTSPSPTDAFLSVEGAHSLHDVNSIDQFCPDRDFSSGIFVLGDFTLKSLKTFTSYLEHRADKKFDHFLPAFQSLLASGGVRSTR